MVTERQRERERERVGEVRTIHIYMASSSAKRIQRELAELTSDPPCNCSAGPKGDNVYEWVSSIVGPAGTACMID